MSERERARTRDLQEGMDAAASGEADGGALAQARQAGDDLLAAFDAIVRQHLSGDSVAFLAMARQEGGQ